MKLGIHALGANWCVIFSLVRAQSGFWNFRLKISHQLGPSGPWISSTNFDVHNKKLSLIYFHKSIYFKLHSPSKRKPVKKTVEGSHPNWDFWQILNFVMTVGNNDLRKSKPNRWTWNKIWFVDTPIFIYNDWHLGWFDLNLFISAISILKSGVSLSMTSI